MAALRDYGAAQGSTTTMKTRRDKNLKCAKRTTEITESVQGRGGKNNKSTCFPRGHANITIYSCIPRPRRLTLITDDEFLIVIIIIHTNQQRKMIPRNQQRCATGAVVAPPTSYDSSRATVTNIITVYIIARQTFTWFFKR